MHNYIALVLYLAIAEVVRRCGLALFKAYTGPLSKLPGPFFHKFSMLPWVIHGLAGDENISLPKLIKQYGDIVRVGPSMIVVADKTSIYKIIVEEDLMKSPEYEMLRDDEKIPTIFDERDRAAHRQIRRLLAPGFSISYLNGLEPLMQQCVQVFVDVLDSAYAKSKDWTVVDLYGVLSNLTTDVISSTAFGGSFNLVRTDDKHLKNIFSTHLQETLLYVNLRFLSYLPFLPKRAIVEIENMVTKILSKRRAAKDNVQRDLLQLLIDANKTNPELMPEARLGKEMSLFMLAGSDTSGTTLVQTVLLLVNNKGKLELLNQELNVNFATKDSPITFANTQDLPYLNAVLNESMRLMPIVHSGFPRYTTKPMILNGYEIPPDITVRCHVSTLFRDPRIWPDAEAFVPERWLEPYKGVEADRKAFIPFSAGSRNCIGQQFALREMRLILVTLLRKFEIDIVPGQSHEQRSHIVPYFVAGKYDVKVRPRNS